jgi:hypothetical protein
VESVAAGQPADVVVVVERVDANCAGIAGDVEHFCGCGGADWVIFVVFFVVGGEGGAADSRVFLFAVGVL